MIYTKNFPLPFEPIAHTEACVQNQTVRFTMLTERLARLEYDPRGKFEDRPSQVFWYRKQPVTQFEVQQNETKITLENDLLHLKYISKPGGFSADSLQIRIKANEKTWRYGQQAQDNLLGTTRTLDRVDGAASLEHGLLNRDGWTLIDDSRSLVFNQDGWLEARRAPSEALDLYFCAYGVDYKACLRDFRLVAGQAPLIPRWALGNWWSRYWAYSADEILELMDTFKQRQIPLSVCIIDMDWHLTRTNNKSSGWTGYTWNQELFPYPVEFLQALHERGLRTALNLHPAEGIHNHEAAYQPMAEQLGLDPQSQEAIALDIANPDYVSAYFEHLHHPLEEEGIDFWWLDWQQGRKSSMDGLDPLWWLNHLHYYDLGRDGEKRSFIFSRWGGLGNHRYPIGFSGDTFVSWESLAFQPYFTATAANVGYGWWSHDIGGHMGGVEDAELFLRWAQYGVFSPIMRLHTTKNLFHERRPWRYDAETAQIVQRAMQLRHQLIPYLYSMAWRDHQHGECLIRPMYHEHPKQEAAYHCPAQYTFGSELIAAPYLEATHTSTHLSRQMVWLPQGEWFGFLDGERYGDRDADVWRVLHGELQDIPVFAKAGALIPLTPAVAWGGIQNPHEIELHCFPGADNRFELFEDDGADSFSITPIQSNWDEERWQIEIGAASGSLAHLPQTRRYRLYLYSIDRYTQINAQVDRKDILVEHSWDDELLAVRLGAIEIETHQQISVRVTALDGRALIQSGDYRMRQCRKLVSHFAMESWAKEALYDLLPDLFEQTDLLGEFALDLDDDQKRALLETITQAGYHRFDDPQGAGETVAIWNNAHSKAIRFRFIARDVAHWIYRQEGVLPRSALIHDNRKGQVRYLNLKEAHQNYPDLYTWLNILPVHFEVQGADIQDMIVQFDLSGEDGRQFYFLVEDGQAARWNGWHSAADVILQCEAEVLLAVINGSSSANDLIENGVVNIIGEVQRALEFCQILSEYPRDQFPAVDWRLEIDFEERLRAVIDSKKD